MEARDDALAIVQTVREPLVVLDADCRVGLANDAFYALFGETRGRRSRASSSGRPATASGPTPTLRRALQAACAGERAARRPRDRAHVAAGPAAHAGAQRAAHRPRRTPDRSLLLADRRRHRRARRPRRCASTPRRCACVDRRKDEFLGILAHELRNPLAPMRFALEILRRSDGDPAETTRRRGRCSSGRSTHMVRIVDDLLDVSRITQGKVELRKEPLELTSVVNGGGRAVPAGRSTRRSHTLTVSLPDEPVTLDADPVRLTQVLVNLLNNAVKFTPPGGHIWLIAETVGEPSAGPDQLRIRVRDTGIGIAPETAADRSSTCSCRAIARSSGRAPASASA